MAYTHSLRACSDCGQRRTPDGARLIFSYRSAARDGLVMTICMHLLLASALMASSADLEKARDLDDRAALERIASEFSAAAQKSPDNAGAQYQAALASSYLAQVLLELRDKAAAERAAKAGIPAAERAVALKPGSSEYHRILGTLCGQVVPANVMLGLSYGKRAQDEIQKAVTLDPKSANAYLARGIGNYYLPPMLGGGPELAIRDIQRAIELDKQSPETYLWLGLALRKLHRNEEAREAFAKSLALNPHRVLTKKQM